MGLEMMFAYQEWPYRQVFKFARETREWAPLFVVHVTDGEHIGRGECGLQSLKNETREIVTAQLKEIRARMPHLDGREELNLAVPACSARNGVDAALWDLECKKTGKSVWELAGVTWAEK